MAILHSILFPRGYPLISRLWFSTPGGPYPVVAPADSLWVRASASGAGGFKDDANGWGGGAAFAFDAEDCAEGDAFTVQVGDCAFTRPSANTAAGDSWVKRANSSLLVSADRGRHNAAGLNTNSTGSVKRSGSAAGAAQGGASAGDDVDDFPLGFGGRGASATVCAWYGGGGGRNNARSFPLLPAGDGLVCVEFFRINPGY